MTGLTAKRWLSMMLAAASLAMLVAAERAAASTLRVSTGSAQRAANEVEADYTTSHVLISETAHETVPITIFFDPQVTGVEAAEVFTNLDRRDWATAAPNGDGVEEGISPPSGNSIAAGDDRHYYKAYPMSPVAGGYLLTLPISKTPAARPTPPYPLTPDPPRAYPCGPT